MSDELVVSSQVDVEVAEIVDEPFATEAEAERFMTRAMSMLREGHEMQQAAKDLLREAQAREAHILLGFESWEDCLASRLADAFQLRIEQAKRIPIVAQLRMEGRRTSEIAEFTGTSRATATRDLNEGRRVGYLSEEPERLMSADGKTRPTRADKPDSGLPRQIRRADFQKSFRNRMHELEKVYRSLLSLRDDDRYRNHLSTLADTHGALLSEVLNLLVDIKEDFVLQDGEHPA